MCSRYILSTTLEAIESKYALSLRGGTTKQPFYNNYNIIPGQFVPVITNEKPYEIQLFKFGLTPFWAKSEMNLFNARAEGDSNQEDNPTYRGATGIILKKAFRKPIRSQRCIVLAYLAFIIETTTSGLKKAYLVYLRNHQHLFAMAGIWDIWLNPQTGDTLNSFSIITTTSNSLLQKIGSKHMPVILNDHESKKWINSGTELSRITGMLNHFDFNLMNAYPISPRIKNPAENDKQLIQPIGEKILIEEKTPVMKYLYTSGYHQAKKAQKANEPNSTMAERIESAKAKESQSNNTQISQQFIPK